MGVAKATETAGAERKPLSDLPHEYCAAVQMSTFRARGRTLIGPSRADLTTRRSLVGVLGGRGRKTADFDALRAPRRGLDYGESKAAPLGFVPSSRDAADELRD